jgi:hypothetical protein
MLGIPTIDDSRLLDQRTASQPLKTTIPGKSGPRAISTCSARQAIDMFLARRSMRNGYADQDRSKSRPQNMFRYRQLPWMP